MLVSRKMLLFKKKNFFSPPKYNISSLRKFIEISNVNDTRERYSGINTFSRQKWNTRSSFYRNEFRSIAWFYTIKYSITLDIFSISTDTWIPLDMTSRVKEKTWVITEITFRQRDRHILYVELYHTSFAVSFLFPCTRGTPFRSDASNELLRRREGCFNVSHSPRGFVPRVDAPVPINSKKMGVRRIVQYENIFNSVGRRTLREQPATNIGKRWVFPYQLRATTCNKVRYNLGIPSKIWLAAPYVIEYGEIKGSSGPPRTLPSRVNCRMNRKCSPVKGDR